MKIDISKMRPLELLAVLLAFSIIIPIALTQAACWSWFDYSNTGEIGDTIGGLTAPFINSVAAVLVFIAFKEQIKANEMIQEQLQFHHIQDQLNKLEDKYDDIIKANSVIGDSVNNLFKSSLVIGGQEKKEYLDPKQLDICHFYVISLNQILDTISAMKYNKDLMLKRTAILHSYFFALSYEELQKSIGEYVSVEGGSYRSRLRHILNMIRNIELRIKEVQI